MPSSRKFNNEIYEGVKIVERERHVNTVAPSIKAPPKVSRQCYGPKGANQSSAPHQASLTWLILWSKVKSQVPCCQGPPVAPCSTTLLMMASDMLVDDSSWLSEGMEVLRG